MTNTPRFDLTLLVLALLTAFGPLSIDMYLPAFAAIADSYQTTSNDVELSLTAFFLGLCIGQLLYGTVADRYGRKPPLYVGLVLYIVSSLALAYASSLESFIGWRFVQAIGSCAGLVIARAMVRDMYTPQASAQVFSWLILVMGIAPIVAPLLGALITDNLGWPAMFLLLAALALLCLLIMNRKLVETRGPDPSVRIASSLSIYAAILRDVRFLRYALPGGIAQSGMFAYITASPLLFIEFFGLDPTLYGWLFASNAIGIISMAQLNAWLLRRCPADRILRRALPTLAVISAALALMGWFTVSVWPLMVGVFCYVSTLGMVFPNTMAGALAEQQQRAGSASALTGSLQFLIAVLVSAAVSWWGRFEPYAMLYVIAGCGLTAWLLYRLLRVGHRQQL